MAVTGAAQRARDLTSVVPLMRDTLISIADETMHMMIVADAQGHILWREGQRDRAEGVGPVTSGAHHSWTCAACPIRDPGTGAVIGAVAVTGPERTLHPTILALVVAVARLAEGHLAVRSAIRNERPRTPRDPCRAVLTTRLTTTAP